MNLIKNIDWKRMWISAALFNFVIALPIIIFTEWTFSLSYGIEISQIDAMAIRLWRDFGIMVLIIDIGYYLVALDLTKNVGIIYLGIMAKLFDVLTLGYRYFTDVAEAIVMIPVLIDAGYTVLFIIFLLQFHILKKADDSKLNRI